MAEKFDKYYEYFSSTKELRSKPRRINLGILSINLGGGPIIQSMFRKIGETSVSTVKGGVMEGEHISLVNPPAEVRVIKGKYINVQNGDLDTIEGEEINLYNVDARRVTGKRIKILNGDVEHVEGEEVTLVNSDVEKVIVTRGDFVNCNIKVLEYKESYNAINTNIGVLRKI
ncbi:hypothetical protein [Caldivirga sp.]|uniref:hypothetical protein n=1 Tax=Caldivirga sp. TaxID=2080243 RepID=UPI0025BB5D9D|nr:hypothetical protein [Caldivirga sp.]